MTRLQDRVDELSKAEIQRLCASRLAEPEDLFIATPLADLLDDAGRVDTDKVQKAVDDLLLRRPAWGTARTPVRNFASGASSQRVAAQSSWADRCDGQSRLVSAVR